MWMVPGAFSDAQRNRVSGKLSLICLWNFLWMCFKIAASRCQRCFELWMERRCPITLMLETCHKTEAELLGALGSAGGGVAAAALSFAGVGQALLGSPHSSETGAGWSTPGLSAPPHRLFHCLQPQHQGLEARTQACED